MDRAILLQSLAQAEKHVALGEKHITRQESLIAELDRDGHDTNGARDVLATLLQSQAIHLESRARILRELSDLGPIQPS